MNLGFKAALECPLPELADLLNRSFAGYLIEIKMDAAALAQMARQDGIDLNASQIILREGEAVGCALIARRGWSCRVAAMGLVTEVRQQGLGRRLMEQLVTGAKARRERVMLLEVIEQNEPAVRLYERLGFRQLRRLVGYHLAQSQAGAAAGPLEEVDLREVARRLTYEAAPDLPWQLSGESLVQAGWPNRGYRLGPAYAAISNPGQSQVYLKALTVPAEARRQGAASRLLQGLLARYPDKSWRVPILWPEELGGLFEKLGFVQEALSQLQMSLLLSPD
jgi:ribosomal protein S18 acetylase RimI-like enzyme